MALKRCLFEYTESEKWKKRYVKKNKNERKSQNCEILSQSNGILFIQFFCRFNSCMFNLNFE